MSASSITTPFLATPDRASAPAARRVARVPRQQPPGRSSIWSLLVTAYRRHRSRQLITHLDAHMLKDIGVTFGEAEREANKPFWAA